jgi:single-strand DNA-binding protein
MINSVVLMGRITAPLELRSTQSGTSVLQFTVAVDRDFVKQGEERQADFISCVAWKQTAEFISRYFGKGRMIALTGRLQSRTYDDKNGSRHYITEMIVQQASFTGEPKQDGGGYDQGNSYSQQGGGYQQGNSYQQPAGGLDYADDPDVISDDGVPF